MNIKPPICSRMSLILQGDDSYDSRELRDVCYQCLQRRKINSPRDRWQYTTITDLD